VRFAVFGCGNRQWARTYQAIPKQIDAALEKGRCHARQGARRDRCRRRLLRRLRGMARRPVGRSRRGPRQSDGEGNAAKEPTPTQAGLDVEVVRFGAKRRCG
jgi:cytochrome P450/NADPH-cytochrome P450 reductase